jgi:hypothetical protein
MSAYDSLQQEEAELSLVESLDGLQPDDTERFFSPGESEDAIRSMLSLPSDTQQQIRKLLMTDEKLQFVEKPSRWRSNIALIVASILGTIAFCFLLIFHSKVNANIIVIMAVFPIALLASGYSIYRGEHRFLVLTDKRIISKPGWGDTQIIEFSALKAVSVHYNWLMLMPELEIKHQLPITMAPRRNGVVRADQRTKTEYIDSVQHLDRYCRFLQQKIDERDSAVEEESSEEELFDV